MKCKRSDARCRRNTKFNFDASEGRVGDELRDFKNIYHAKPRFRANSQDSLLLLALRPGLGILCRLGQQSQILSSFFKKLTWAAILLSFCFLFQNSYANVVSAASLTLTIPSESLSINVSDPKASSGFSKSATASVTVKTDLAAGYTFSIKSKTSSDLVSGSSKITSISAATSESDFSTKGAVNTWGYKPSKLNSATNDNFQPAPTTSNTVIDKTSAANTDTANSYDFTIAAKVDNNTLAGNYIGTFVITALGNTTSYTINYNLNSGSWSGTTPQTGSTAATNVTIDSHTPSKSGYTFRGWCSSSSISNNNTTSSPSCSGTTYQPSGTYNLTPGVANTLNLYAMWQQNATSYYIYYVCSSGTPCPSTQSGTTTSSSVTLSSTTPSKSGYTFSGWCSTSPTSNNTTNVSCSGYTYQPSASYPLSRGASPTLYAMWEADEVLTQYSCPQKVTSCKYGIHSGKRYGDSPCYRNAISNYVVHSNISATCMDGWRLPRKSDFNNLVSSAQAGSGACLYEQGWKLNGMISPSGSPTSLKDSGTKGYYWSSDLYYLIVTKTSASAKALGGTGSDLSVRCVHD